MIGYYVHHQGEGHVTRAAAIAAHLHGTQVTGLSSRTRPDGWAGPWVRLERDDAPAPGDGADPAAGGVLHWAPLAHAGLRARMAQIAAWVAATAPRLVIVDVSVEVTVLVRTMGVPVVVMALPGARSDPAHQLAYRLAKAIIAPWPAWAEMCHRWRRLAGQDAHRRGHLPFRRAASERRRPHRRQSSTGPGGLWPGRHRADHGAARGCA